MCYQSTGSNGDSLDECVPESVFTATEVVRLLNCRLWRPLLSPQPLLSQLTTFVNSYQPLLSTSPLLSTFVNSELTNFVLKQYQPHMSLKTRSLHLSQGTTTFVNRNVSTSYMLSHNQILPTNVFFTLRYDLQDNICFFCFS